LNGLSSTLRPKSFRLTRARSAGVRRCGAKGDRNRDGTVALNRHGVFIGRAEVNADPDHVWLRPLLIAAAASRHGLCI